MGGGKPQELALGNSSAPARRAGGRVPRSLTKARGAAAALPEGPAHTPGSWIPAVPRAEPPGAGLQTCSSALSHSSGAAFLEQLSPPARACQSARAPATGFSAPGLGAPLPQKVFYRRGAKESASKDNEQHCSSWNGSSLGWEVETCLGGDGSPLGR